MDSLNITTTGALVQIVENEKNRLRNAVWFAKLKSNRHIHNLLERKVLGVFFHDIHDLPMMFSFSKYLCENQDSQIVDFIEIDIFSWNFALALACWVFCNWSAADSQSLLQLLRLEI
ncbi:hypothetical protein THRCLA_09832 [Thraustotheca clavata]|uniref:Uncharacterized protein n=1 Tax=Thraustotheca clavata TaxID=74557 RepID=A0A1V9YU71_9STRA|nr:hypothetical protein THRCLA_09832 [Thraustotheca clavata]